MNTYVVAMRLLALIYIAAALAVHFLNQQIIYLVNFIPQVFNLFQVIPPTQNYFWVLPVSGYCLTLSLISLASSFDTENRVYLAIHLTTKLAMLLGFLGLFFYEQKYFAYLFGALIELKLFTYVLWSFTKSTWQKNHPETKPAVQPTTTPEVPKSSKPDKPPSESTPPEVDKEPTAEIPAPTPDSKDSKEGKQEEEPQL